MAPVRSRHAERFLGALATSVVPRLGRLRGIGRLPSLDPDMRREHRDAAAVRAIMSATLRPDANVVDAGANAGAVLEDAVRIAPDGWHVAFEPIPALARSLRDRFSGAEIHEAALADRAGRSPFMVASGMPEYSGLMARDDVPRRAGPVRSIEVDVVRLDDSLPDDYVPHLIKVDVEGAEVLALLGARRTLERHRPLVLFEHGVGGADVYGTTSEQLWDLLYATGHRIFDLEGDGPFSRETFTALWAQPVWNYVAVPVSPSDHTAGR